jgi:ABC-type transport system involved in multi-copper enzyme maturation permease subunit
MTAQLRSELLKLRTTRTTVLLLLGAVGLTLFATCVEGISPATGKLAHEQTQREMLSAVTSGVLFATFAGLLAVTSEFRYGTIRPTLLIEPRRNVVLSAKLCAAALAGFVIAAVTAAVAFGGGLVLLAVRGVDYTVSAPHTLELVLGSVAAATLSAVIGAMVGTLIRNQSSAILALVVYAFVVDAVLFAAVPSAGRFLPGKAGDALLGRPVDHLLAPGAGAVVLALWAAAFVTAAVLRFARSDV